MKSAILQRLSANDQGTYGLFLTAGWWCWTLELPWRDNRRNRSCIPSGQYEVEMIQSPKYGHVYHVQDVPDRTGILIHSGNYAGDIDLGFKTHSAGCIIVGKRQGWLSDQRAVLVSRPTLRQLHQALELRDFTLDVRGGDDGRIA